MNIYEKWLYFKNKIYDETQESKPLEETFSNLEYYLSLLRLKHKPFIVDIQNMPWGTFVLYFENGDKELSIEIGKTKVGYIADWLNESHEGFKIIRNFKIPAQIKRLLNNLIETK